MSCVDWDHASHAKTFAHNRVLPFTATTQPFPAATTHNTTISRSHHIQTTTQPFPAATTHHNLPQPQRTAHRPAQPDRTHQHNAPSLTTATPPQPTITHSHNAPPHTTLELTRSQPHHNLLEHQAPNHITIYWNTTANPSTKLRQPQPNHIQPPRTSKNPPLRCPHL